MRKQIFFLFVVLCITVMLSSCAKSPDKLIIGEWEGTDHTGETGSMIFYKDGNLEMIQDNVVMVGSSADRRATWRIDERHSPMHLDIVFTESSGETEFLPMIIQFISNTKIQLRMSDDMTSRPTEFSESDKINQITLTKQ